MKREVVQDFLNLPGIAGVALMDGRSRPYFCGVDQALNFQQKETLAQGIQQVVATTPADFEFFEFQFTEHQVYIYKLDHGIILLVLTNNDLPYLRFIQAVERLKGELQDDFASAIATFRLLAGNTTLSEQHYWKRRTESSPLPEDTQTWAVPESGVSTNAGTQSTGSSSTASSAKPETRLEDSDASSPPSDSIPTPGDIKPADTPTSLKEVLAALNHFSQFTTQYLGPTVVTNYWKATRPEVDWLSNFQVDRSAQITVTTVATPSTEVLNEEQHQWIRDWTSAFIQRCSKVIRDFPTLIEQRSLNDRERALLLPEKN